MLRPYATYRDLVPWHAAFRSPAPGLSFRAMTHSTTVALPPQDVLERAKRFFAERVPNAAAFAEKEGPGFLVLRGQGGDRKSTSELQSQSNLVCRLLLEKKK